MPGKYGRGRRAGKENNMNLSSENYATLLMMTNDRIEEVKDMLSLDPTDKEYWEEQLKEIKYIRSEILRATAEIDPA